MQYTTSLVFCGALLSSVMCTDHIAITATTEAPIPTHTVTSTVHAPRATITVTQSAPPQVVTQTITKHVTAILPATATATATAPAATHTAVATSSIEEINDAVPKKPWWKLWGKADRGEIVRYTNEPVDKVLHAGTEHRTVGDRVKNLLPGHNHSHRNVTTRTSVKSGSEVLVNSGTALVIGIVGAALF